MKIGILTDSHDNMLAITKAVGVFNDAEVSLVIHAGDLVAPFTAIPLKQLKADFIAVFGNNDGEKLGLTKVFDGKIHRPPHFLVFGGKRILILHEPDNLQALADSGHFDMIVYGHTHEVDVQKGRTLVVNPGECCGWVKGKRSVGLWDTATGNVDIVPL